MDYRRCSLLTGCHGGIQERTKGKSIRATHLDPLHSLKLSMRSFQKYHSYIEAHGTTDHNEMQIYNAANVYSLFYFLNKNDITE